MIFPVLCHTRPVPHSSSATHVMWHIHHIPHAYCTRDALCRTQFDLSGAPDRKIIVRQHPLGKFPSLRLSRPTLNIPYIEFT